VITNAWGYVAAGYGITFVVLAGYVTWMSRRRRHLERLLSGEKDG